MKLTVVVITHEMQVVKEICDQVAIMENGRIVEKGDIVSIFTKPKEQITKNFMDTTNNSHKINELIENNHPLTQLEANQQLIRLSYSSTSTKEAIISRISQAYHIECSIIFGNIEVIQNEPIGTMIIVLTGEGEDIKKALQYCKDNHVDVEVIKRGYID